MAKLEVLTIKSVLELVNLKAAYFLGYGLLLGTGKWDRLQSPVLDR